MSCIRRINNALRKAGAMHRLHRNPTGYYYLYTIEDAAPATPYVECSIYTWRLDEDDYAMVARDINHAYRQAGLTQPITLS